MKAPSFKCPLSYSIECLPCVKWHDTSCLFMLANHIIYAKVFAVQCSANIFDVCRVWKRCKYFRSNGNWFLQNNIFGPIFSDIKLSQSRLGLHYCVVLYSQAMVSKFLFLFIVGISTLSGAEAQACVAGGNACLDASYNSLGNCCAGAVCTPSGFGGFCMMDSSCIAGGYPCMDNSYSSLGPCCSGSTCVPVPGSSSGAGFCLRLSM